VHEEVCCDVTHYFLRIAYDYRYEKYFTFVRPCIVINFVLITNQTH